MNRRGGDGDNAITKDGEGPNWTIGGASHVVTSNLDSTMLQYKLFCIIPNGELAFVVNIDGTETVADLKELPLLSPPFQADPEHLRTRQFFSLSPSLFLCSTRSNIVNYKSYCFLQSPIRLVGRAWKNMIEAVLGSKVFGLAVRVKLTWFSFS